MYRAIVARRIRTAWEHLARGDYGYVLDQFAPTFTHPFAGNPPLGGRPPSRETQRTWFERLFRLLPGVEFRIEDVLVRGWPWRTRAVALIRVPATAARRPHPKEVGRRV